jgi:hypothetical protein
MTQEFEDGQKGRAANAIPAFYLNNCRKPRHAAVSIDFSCIYILPVE